MRELIKAPRLEKETTLFNLLNDFMEVEVMGLSPKRVHEYRRHIEDFIIYLSRRGLSPKTVSSYGQHISSGMGAWSIYYRLVCIRRYLKWCFLMGYTKERWYEYLPKLKTSPIKTPKIVGQDEYMLLRKACNGCKDKEWLIILSYNTGFRLGDCCTLLWSDIDLDKQVITKVLNKTMKSTGASSSIPYTTNSDLHIAIMDRLTNKDNAAEVYKDYVCPEMAMTYMACAPAINNMFTKVFSRAGIPDKTFKHLRCTFESRMANSGMNMGLAAKITGRSDPRTLMHYIRPDIDAAREGVAKALQLHNQYAGFA